MNDNPTMPAAGGTPESGTGSTGEVRRLASDTKEDVRSVAQDVQREARTAVEQKREDVARRVGSVAAVLRDAATRLEQEQTGLDQLAATAADGLDRASRYLREREPREMRRDAETLARRHPELVLGGAFLAGLAVARLLKSTPRPEPEPIGYTAAVGGPAGDTGVTNTVPFHPPDVAADTAPLGGGYAGSR
jgi:hypothetical protein